VFINESISGILVKITAKHIFLLNVGRTAKLIVQGMVDRIIEIGRCYGMETNVEKTNVMKISRQLSPNKNYDRSKAIGECGIFQLFG
jgi:hypothetical protein